MKASARFLNESWCIDFAHVDNLARVNNGVKNLLIYKDLFERTLYAKGMKTKNSKETVRAFLTMITKKINPEKFESSKDQKLQESSKNFAKLKEYKVTLQ